MVVVKKGGSYYTLSGKVLHLSMPTRDRILMLDAGADANGRCKLNKWHRWVGFNGLVRYEIPVWKKVGKRKKMV